MKKIVSMIFFSLFFIPSSLKAFEYDNNKIYFFYQPSCPHCHKAINYIQTTYPDINMELVNIPRKARNPDSRTILSLQDKGGFDIYACEEDRLLPEGLCRDTEIASRVPCKGVPRAGI